MKEWIEKKIEVEKILINFFNFGGYTGVGREKLISYHKGRLSMLEDLMRWDSPIANLFK